MLIVYLVYNIIKCIYIRLFIMLEILGGIFLTMTLLGITSNLPILGFILTVIAAFFYPWLWVLVIIYIILVLIGFKDMHSKR